ncbi:hypothetical protein T210_0138665 [Burkholderia pseudomallei MSHR6137]|nr:hypothetical protein T210_0138665 [Burkholderia pseudomallei MSHR6137]
MRNNTKFDGFARWFCISLGGYRLFANPVYWFHGFRGNGSATQGLGIAGTVRHGRRCSRRCALQLTAR